MSRNPVPSLALLAAVTAIGFCALQMVVPVLPLLATAFDDRAARVQLVLALYLAGIAGGQLVYGPLSDRFGRRPVLIAGLAMFLVGTLLCGVAWSLAALIFGRVLEGSGACAGIVLGRAIIRDIYDREAAARGLAIVMMAMTVARLAETNTHPAPLDIVGMAVSYITLLRSPQFLGFALCSACTSASWFTFIAGTPYLLSDVLRQPPSTYGLMILLPMAGYLLGNAAAARFAFRLGSLRLVIWGRAVAFAAAIVMVLWYLLAGLDTWLLFVPIALCSIGDGLSQPAVMAAGLSIYPRLAGTASGLMGFLQMTVAALGTFLVALLPHDSALGMIVVVGGFIALALAFGIFAVRRPLGGSVPDVPVLQLRREESV